MKSARVLVGILVVAAVLTGAYFLLRKGGNQLTNTNTEPETGPITMGVILPLTGDFARYGEPGKNVIQLAVDEINSQGGVNGRALEVVYEDGKCNGRDAANVMQKLVDQDKVKVVIGGFCDSESLAAVPIASSARVILFSPASGSPNLTNASQFFFRDYPSDAIQGKVLAEVAAQEKNWKKVALIQEQLDYPLGIYNAFSEQFSRFGGTMLKESFASETADFKPQLMKLRDGKPDALFVDTLTASSTDRVLKAVQDLKWKLPIMVSDAVSTDARMVQKYSTLLEGALAAEFGTEPNNTKFQHLLDIYKAKYGSDLPHQKYGQTEYDAVMILKDAMVAAGHDAEKISAWARTLKDWQGASGVITIGADGDRVGGHVAKVIKKGKVEFFDAQSATSTPATTR